MCLPTLEALQRKEREDVFGGGMSDKEERKRLVEDLSSWAFGRVGIVLLARILPHRRETGTNVCS